jgi:IS5 family transposase
MKQQSLATVGFKWSTKRRREREFLDEISLVVSWAELVSLVQPHAPAGKTGRPPVAVDTMLRIHFIQQWFGLSDSAMGEALHDVPLYCQLARLDPGMSRLPDESTILRFCQLLEEHALSLQIMAAIHATLAKRGLMLKTGTVVDATLIAAPSSTKNKDGERYPEMHQTKKGNHWHFGMKAHIGVDADSGLMHSAIGTAANGVTQGHGLLHGKETVMFADARYQGVDKRPEATEVQWQVGMRPSKRRALREAGTGWGALLEQAEKVKASVRTKVEHPFRVIKRQFGHTKVRYRGLAKNTAQLITLLVLPNLWMARKALMQRAPQG